MPSAQNGARHILSRCDAGDGKEVDGNLWQPKAMVVVTARPRGVCLAAMTAEFEVRSDCPRWPLAALASLPLE